jgi:hypothetical protein
MSNNIVTSAWLLWRPGEDGQPMFFGMVQDGPREVMALAELGSPGWEAKEVMFFGWGFLTESGRVLTNEDFKTRPHVMH